jgi:hypothetical protein
MISLAAIEETHAPRILPQLKPDDQRLSELLDVAEFYRWKHETDGSRTAWFQLKKAIKGLPAGTVIELSALHERLFGEPLKKP